MRKIVLTVVAVVSVVFSYGQREKGSWNDYLSYTHAVKIAVAPTKVYCATEGGIVFYDREDNSVSKLSAITNLSDFGIKTMIYSEQSDMLIVAYNNCNIDLVYENRVTNLSDIKRKQLSGKNINNISLIDNEAYLSCSFGIVVLNLEKREVKDTYIIGEGGSFLSVNDVEADSEFLYAATDNGILKAEKNGTNLLDYNNWTLVEDIPHSNDKFNHLVNHQGKLIANYTPEQWYQDEMYTLNGDVWEPYVSQIRYVFDIQVNGNYLVVASRSDVFVIDNNHVLVRKINNYQLGDKSIAPIQPQSAGISDGETIWIADAENSMVKVSGENYESVVLNGPIDNNIFTLHQAGPVLWVSPGNKRGWERPRFQRFNDDTWKHFSKEDYPELDGFFNIISVAVDPFRENHFYAASWGGGLLEYENDVFVQRYTNHNSPLETALPQQPAEPYVRVGGMDFDSEGNLWLTNSEVEKVLVKRTPEGEWESVFLPEIANGYSIGQLLVTQNDDKWILLPSGHDAYVVDKTGTAKKRLLVTSYFYNGEKEILNRMNDVHCIAEDLEGGIWIGTSKGVAVYNNPGRIWDSETFYATQPSLDLGDGKYHPLLETETVTSIAVDGANRKWIGTERAGVYLISENGESEIQHFTSDNSPLLSNNIMDIAVNQQSGEVFFGTSEGLISYQGDAIGGKNTYANVYVYPNPVRETYDGPVTITGLIENTDVKITDITGNLVFQTTSLGGQAVWDGTNLNGNRVKTGVYLIFCNDEAGEETHIEKLLFIH
ncbi:T9SS C-terminal target domain-containing protein [Mariniphaga sediminis]|uniref:T9SS C-terminal target domain-containing protein n=1 Tax=Mariniphaga sediminis TaxID=1628158 RepID=A0A399D1Z3_9BACT|nr:T9SS type A sorting domain-containing protein [Mariniphaga sediminis]RIH65597.1 T9SS C-terminal target domain-containing protein [Mariniphaga sediminis]